MELTYENVSAWFDEYFESVSRNIGPFETVADLAKYFTDDLEFWMYTPPSFMTSPLNRAEFLLSLVHPGIHDEMTPRYYVLDLRQNVLVARVTVQFSDEISGEELGGEIEASAHYHFVLDEAGDLKINRIFYWTETPSPEDIEALARRWEKSKQQALTGLALDYLTGS